MSTDRIWSNGERVAEEMTPILRSYLRSLECPAELVDNCHVRFDRQVLTFFGDCEDAAYEDWEYGTTDEPAHFGMRLFFFYNQEIMRTRVERYICEELDAFFI